MKVADLYLLLVDRQFEHVHHLRLLHYFLALFVVVFLKPNLIVLLDILPVPIRWPSLKLLQFVELLKVFEKLFSLILCGQLTKSSQYFDQIVLERHPHPLKSNYSIIETLRHCEVHAHPVALSGEEESWLTPSTGRLRINEQLCYFLLQID